MPDHPTPPPTDPAADPAADPVVSVTKVEYDTASRLVGDPIIGLRAETIDATGTVIHWSRLPGEAFWAADALFRRGDDPVFVNGYGARYLRFKVATPKVAAILDAAVADAGLTLAPEPDDDSRGAANPPSTDPPSTDPQGDAQ